MSSSINQKEYLKKYLSSDNKLLKKKKKKHSVGVKKSTVRIIDDDDVKINPGDLENIEIDEGDLYGLQEEAPQIVGVIDERAPEVLLRQEYQESGKWKSLDSTKKKSRGRRRSRSVEIVKTRDEIIDLSPPRRKRKSPKRHSSTDESPPRRLNRNNESKISREPKNVNEDQSPPRISKKSSRWGSEKPEKSSFSPIRKRKLENEDNSPPRRYKEDSSPPRRYEKERSPPRRYRSPPKIKQENKNSPQRSSKMTKTLDGKMSGLQNAKDLKRENYKHERRQEKLFREIDPSLSGRHAKELQVRDTRGRNREYEKNYERDSKKAEAEEVRKQKYDKWNKGLKQLEDIEKRRQEWKHEAAKPLARSADDKDLENHLKEQERLDDPMLQYMRSKKKKKDIKEGVLQRPEYIGSYPDNRFHIKPGYRWDGVNRSNGYEKKHFEMISLKKSLEEDAYRYSTEDM